MNDFAAALPVLLHAHSVLLSHTALLQSYLGGILALWGVSEPVRLCMSLLLPQLLGLEYLSHYQQQYAQIAASSAPHFCLYGAEKLRKILSCINTSMAAWKLLHFQARLLKKQGTPLLSDVLDLDWTTLPSFASKRQGAEVGMNKKYKGKPCYQLTAAFMGKVFVDARLFAGCCNPKDFFRKAVKRVQALGYTVKTVRADSAYLTLENLHFLQMLSLGYAIGAPASFRVVAEGIELFKRRARAKHRTLLPVRKGVCLLDIGWGVLGVQEQTRLLIVRRISRRKNKSTGKWRVRTYYYAIASNLELSAIKLYEFYHQRQGIEAGFRELKQHYHLLRLPVQNLKGNEFWIICKILAMTLMKLFQLEMLPSALRPMLRATLLRVVLAQAIAVVEGNLQLQLPRKAKYHWVLLRLFGKMQRMNLASIP